MSAKEETLLLISGPVGVGKTTIANELSNLLEDDGVPHTYVDLDYLTCTFPRSDADPYGNKLALQNLQAVWENSRKLGSKNLIIPRVIESKAEAAKIAAVVGIATPIICRLTASDQTLLERVRTREIGSGLLWHEKRSIQLSAELSESKVEQLCIATDNRSVTEIATELMQQVGWER